MKKKTIIFDFDGTLADSLHVVIQVYNSIAPHFNTKKIEIEKMLYYRNIPTRQLLKELNISNWKLPCLLFFVKNKLKKRKYNIEFFDGMKDVVTTLSEKKIQLGIVTNNSKKFVQRFLEKENLENNFDFIYSSRTFYGKDKKLQKLINNYNLERENVLYIGDEIKDIEACKKVSIPIMAVTWGGYSSEILESYNPEYLIDNPKDILTFFNR